VSPAEIAGDRRTEQVEVGLALVVEDLVLDELPQPFDEIEVGRIRGQEDQLDAEAFSSPQYHSATLVACIIENDHKMALVVADGKLLEQGTKRSPSPRRWFQSS
jgi:hypothetical protein